MCSRNIWYFILIALFLVSLYSLFGQKISKPETVEISKVVEQVQKQEVDKITVESNKLTVLLKDNKQEIAYKEADAKLSDYGITGDKVKIDVKGEGKSGLWMGILYSFLPVLIIVGFFYWMMRQAATGGRQALSFGETRARLFGPGKTKVTFSDVAGLKEAKQELMEVVEFLKNPRKFRELGAEIPRGVLLTGPSGTGKTLLAKAVAGEAGVPFFSISASEFIEMFVGVGASTSYDTKILIKTKDSTRLIPIGEFVNRFYKNNEEGFPIEVKDVWTLGADWARGTKFFKSSSWKKVKSVYRHKVDKIYEIYFTGGKIEVTGDHSIFIRNKNHIICKRADELRIGDILLGLPYKVRGLFVPGIGTTHKIRTHQFSKEPIKELIVWPLDGRVNNQIPLSISKALGWRYGGMRLKTNDLTKFLPYKIKVTPALMKLMGYYTAEGLSHKRSRSLRFCFGSHEKDLHRDCIKLMRKVFNLDEPKFFHNNNKDKSALVIYYNSLPIAQFFLKYCGNGAHNKHVPEFVWDLPKEYFVSYLEGLVKGDGYINKRGMIEFTSCSKQLISELRWLLNMHGIPCSVTKYTQLGGRIIKNSKTPLPKSTYWRITIAKSINPFSSGDSTDFSAKPTIKKIIKKPYNGYVYDLCGCENEAFFGGEKPILLHNSRVRSTFQKAKRNAPSIIYIDELDAIGRVRGAGIGGGHDEREQTLNQILVEMDGFETDEKVIIMSSTNRPDILDPALLRPGRFDRKIVLDLPDVKEREEILKIHTRGKPLESNVNLERIAKITAGFSGADLRNLANEAAILAARRNKKKISQNELEESIEKVLLGPERKSHLLSEKEKKITAYHETGHALLSHLLPNCDPVHKISIISRGPAAGYTWSLPTEDKKLHSKAEFEDNLVALLGGRTAEEISFGDITTGAQNDLKRATKIAKDMVTQYGMTEKLGPITWGEREELVFLGKELGEQKTYSEETASKIDLEVKNIIEKASKKAKQILSKNKSQLKKVAEKLIKEETLEGAELEKLFPRKQKA